MLLATVLVAGCGERDGGAERGTAGDSVAADTAGGAGVADAIAVEGPWVRVSVTPPAGPGPMPPVNTAAYMALTNRTDSTETLMRVATGAADTVEIHSATRDGDVVQMRPVGSVVLPPGGRAVLEPGGLHVMLVGLTAPVAEGDSVDLQLHFRSGRVIEITAPVLRSPPRN